jgi:hypothetical protein
MTAIDRQRRNGVARLIKMREHNDALMKEVEAERDRLLTQGNLILSPVWSRCGPKPANHGMVVMTVHYHRRRSHSVTHVHGPTG